MNYTLGKLSSCLPHLIPASSARAQTHADILPIHWNLPTPLPWKRLALMTDNDKHFYVIEPPSLFSSQQKKEKKVDGPADSGVNLYGHGYLLHVVTAAVHNSKVGSSQTTRFAFCLCSVGHFCAVVQYLFDLCGEFDSVILSHFQNGRGYFQRGSLTVLWITGSVLSEKWKLPKLRLFLLGWLWIGLFILVTSL